MYGLMVQENFRPLLYLENPSSKPIQPKWFSLIFFLYIFYFLIFFFNLDGLMDWASGLVHLMTQL
jgi:hypothetical protein